VSLRYVPKILQYDQYITFIHLPSKSKLPKVFRASVILVTSWISVIPADEAVIKEHVFTGYFHAEK